MIWSNQLKSKRSKNNKIEVNLTRMYIKAAKLWMWMFILSICITKNWLL